MGSQPPNATSAWRNWPGKVGLRPEHLRRYPHVLGGQRQRIAIARAMILNPGIVVADEPVSALDVSIQAQILNLFLDLQAEFQTAYVFISHNLSVVEHVADELMVMYLQQRGRSGRQAPHLCRAATLYTRALMSATPQLHAADRRERIPAPGRTAQPPEPRPLAAPSTSAARWRPRAAPRRRRCCARSMAGRWPATWFEQKGPHRVRAL